MQRLRRLRRLLSLLKCPHDHAARIQGWCGGFVTTTQPRFVTIRTHTPTSGAITAPNTNLTGFSGRFEWNYINRILRLGNLPSAQERMGN